MNILLFLGCHGLIYGFVLSKKVPSQPVIKIKNGKIRGSVEKTVEQEKTFYAFRSIPYAKPPLGDLRFRSPITPDDWNYVLDATRDRDGCVQGDKDKDVIGSEDCLFVNVYTPSLTKKMMPVMVFIHGGTFIHQNSTYFLYGPDYFLDKGVVFVSLNYRLGIFGYLSTEDMASPGNWGLKDQLLALQWVQKNIALFGGNPKNVTLFGQSAGAISVSYLALTPKASGLFQAVIMQSGTSLCMLGLFRQGVARKVAFKSGEKVGVKTKNSTELVQKLRKIDYKKLHLNSLAIASKIAAALKPISTTPFAIVKEPHHKDALFVGRSYELWQKGQFIRVPMIIGFNSNEAAFAIDTITSIWGTLYVAVLKIDQSRLNPVGISLNKTIQKKVGDKIYQHYNQLSQINDTVRYFSQTQFVRPIRKTVILASKYVPVYYYEFSHEGLLNLEKTYFPGVGHAEELNYLFRRNISNLVSKSDLITRKRLVTLWTNFAKYKKPIVKSEKLFDQQTWPRASSKNLVYLNIGNETVSLKKNPEEKDMEFYEQLYSEYGQPPYTTY